MKRIAVMAVIMFFAGSGPLSACLLCDDLRVMGYTDSQISRVIRSGASRAEAEAKMKKLIAEGPKKALSQQSPPTQQPMAAAASRPAEVRSQPAPTLNPFATRYTWNGKTEE